MVYMKGYGLADAEDNEEMNENHVFRVASISKTFTGAAIMHLIQNGNLSMDQKLFGEGSIFGNRFLNGLYGDDLLKLRVRHLLHHTSGGWGGRSGGDPIDYQPDLNDEDFIQYVLENWPLAHEPGDQFVYSNMGYYLLARIIEEVSGKSYPDYLEKDLLADLQLPTLHVTNFDLDDRQPNEVEYHGQGQDQQYIYTIADRRDGDAGVVISASDLLKFVNAIDGFSSRPDILNADILDLFTTAPPTNTGYAAGISTWDQQNIWFHYGALPGIRSGFMRHDNGINMVLLFNSKPVEGYQDFVFDIQATMLDILNNNQISYQDIDLFDN